ncbi:hypothetical protein [Streptomyces sp. NPDC055189]
MQHLEPALTADIMRLIWADEHARPTPSVAVDAYTRRLLADPAISPALREAGPAPANDEPFYSVLHTREPVRRGAYVYTRTGRVSLLLDEERARDLVGHQAVTVDQGNKEWRIAVQLTDTASALVAVELTRRAMDAIRPLDS